MNPQPNTPASRNEAVAVVPRGVYGPDDGRPGEPYGNADWIEQNHEAVIQFLERSVAAPGAAMRQVCASTCTSAKIDRLPCKCYPALTSRQEALTEQEDGYANAFYELGKLMGIPAQPISPERVWREQMLPTLQKALAVRIASRSEAPAASAQVSAELNGAVASLQAAVIFTDQMRAAAAAGEDVTATGVARDAREWLERAARALIDALSKPATPSEALSPAAVAQPVDLQVHLDAIWMYAQLYADEHAASIDPLRTHAAIEGAKRRKMQHEVALRQSVRELAAQPCASQGCGGAVSEGLTDEQISDAWREMPGGPEGWLKQFGYIQFARVILKHAGMPHHPPRVTVEMFEQLRQTYNLASEVSIRLSDIRAALSTAPRSLDGATPGGNNE